MYYKYIFFFQKKTNLIRVENKIKILLNAHMCLSLIIYIRVPMLLRKISFLIISVMERGKNGIPNPKA
jgi:hypothetical protein